MKKGLIAGLAGLAAAVCLAPFELKANTEGDFTYKSILVGVTRKKDGDAPASYELSFFNRPPVTEIGDKIQSAAQKAAKTVRDVVIPQPTEIVFDSSDVSFEAADEAADETPATEPAEE